MRGAGARLVLLPHQSRGLTAARGPARMASTATRAARAISPDTGAWPLPGRNERDVRATGGRELP
jgi:hypothetical protein